jgi:hypothetical protein
MKRRWHDKEERATQKLRELVICAQGRMLRTAQLTNKLEFVVVETASMQLRVSVRGAQSGIGSQDLDV